MAGKKKMEANKPSTDKGSAKFAFLSVPAQAGTFNSGSVNTDGKQKPKK